MKKRFDILNHPNIKNHNIFPNDSEKIKVFEYIYYENNVI